MPADISRIAARPPIRNLLMPTLPIRAPHAPDARLLVPGFTQVVAGFKAMLDIFAEADRMVWQARERYPLAD
jgi:hypothetical protein